jgi:hypothetical protein
LYIQKVAAGLEAALEELSVEVSALQEALEPSAVQEATKLAVEMLELTEVAVSAMGQAVGLKEV